MPGSAPSIGDGDFSVSYPQLDELASRLDARLTALGVFPTDTIAIRADQTLATVVALRACLDRAQSAILIEPLDQHRPPAYCRYEVRVRVHGTPSHVDRIDAIVSQLDGWVAVRGEHHDHTLGFGTSGTSGEPRVFAHTYAALQEGARAIGRRLALCSTDRILIPVPIRHRFGFGVGLLPALSVGASVEVLAGRQTFRYFERERSFAPTIVVTTPSLAVTTGHRCHPTRKVTIMGGDVLPRHVFDAYKHRESIVVQIYGSTELGVIAAHAPDEPSDVRASTVGRPLDDVAVHIDDRGQLWCRSAYGSVACYDKNGGCTRHHGFIGTGDLAELTTTGHLRIKGRLGTLIKRDGYWASLLDIEHALLGVPQVENIAVVVDGASERGTRMVAFTVLRRDATEAVLREAALAHVPRRAVPDAFRIIESLPLLPSGKVDRECLRRMCE